MRRLTLLLSMLLIAGCASTQRHPQPQPQKLYRGVQSCTPAPGTGHMGICAPKTSLPGTQGLTAAPRGRLVPDASSYQGHPDWAAARPYISGAIVKTIEYSVDPSFAYNWRQLRALHIWHAGYDFLRPGDCAAQGRTYVAAVDAQGGFDGPGLADAEVPLPYGCTAAWVATVESLTHQQAVVYTSSGTWPGGAHGDALLWDAAYGPSSGCVWTCSVVAWQFTDGQYGPYPHGIPGVGSTIDVSQDRGITTLGPQPTPKPRPVHHSRVRERAHLRDLEHRVTRTRVHLRNLGCYGRHQSLTRRERCGALKVHGARLHHEITYLHHHYHI